MQNIDHIPLGALFALTVALVLIAIECGHRLGARFGDHTKSEHEASVSTMIQSTLALLAFLLAFTFGVAAERFNDRRVLVIEDSNAIRTTYLRADFLPDANRDAVQNLLREYVALRVTLTRDPNFLPKVIVESDRLHGLLWAQAVQIGKANLDSDVTALFVESLNDTFNEHSKRVAARLYARIPDSIWVMLYFMMFLGMIAMGYQSGISRTRSWPITTALVLSFAVVTVLIADLDRPAEGFLNPSQQPMLDLANKIGLPAQR
jgi:hypothetical protein